METSRRFAALCFNIALGASWMLSGAAHASPGSRVLLTFTDKAIGVPLYNQYGGVEFVDPNAPRTQYLPLTGGYKIVTAPAGSVSTAAVLATPNFPCGGGGEFPAYCAEARLHFAEPQSDVVVSLGLGSAPGVGRLNATAYDAQGAVVATGTTGDQCAGPRPLPARYPIEITDTSSRIVSLQIVTVGSCPKSLESYGDTPPPSLLIDNLTYTAPYVEPPNAQQPPVLTILTPISNGWIPVPSGGDPDAVAFKAQAASSGLSSLTLSVNGGAPINPQFSLDPTKLNYAISANLGSQTGIVKGANTIALTVVDFSGHSVSQRVTFNTGPVPPPPTSRSAHPTGLEVTQGYDKGPVLLTPNLPPISSSPANGYDVDWRPNYPLVAGKDTLIRLYGGTTAGLYNRPIPALFDVALDNCSSNCALDTADFPVDVNMEPNPTGVVLGPLNYSNVSPNVTNPSGTWNFWVPAFEASGDLVVTLHINPPTLDNSVEECTSNGDRECLNDNTVKIHLHFQQPIHIPLDTVDIIAGGTFSCNGASVTVPTGSIGLYNDGTNNISEQQDVDMWAALGELWPFTVDPRYQFYVGTDVGADDDSTILKRVKYYANGAPLIGRYPVFNESTPAGCGHKYAANQVNPDGSFVAGLSDIGKIGGWYDDDNPLDAVHELQHTLGFPHWICAFGAANCSAKYPLPFGGMDGFATSLSGWPQRASGAGFNATTQLFVLPPGDTGSLLSSQAHDVMTYGSLCSEAAYGGAPGCNTGEWTSAFDRSIVAQAVGLAQIAGYDGTFSVDPPVVLLSGTIPADGPARLDTAYLTQGSLSRERSSSKPGDRYSLEGYDANGNVIFVHNFQPAPSASHRAAEAANAHFWETVSPVDGVDRIVLKRTLTGEARGRIQSTHAPIQVQGLSPPSGALLSGVTKIQWSTSNRLNVPVRTLVEWAPEPRGRRVLVGEGPNTVGWLPVDVDLLAGSNSGYFYVTVSDGVQNAVAQIGPVQVAMKPPLVTIMRPRAAQRVQVGRPFAASGFARELGLQVASPKSFQWLIDGKPVASGVNAQLPGVGIGPHTVELQSTDDGGRIGKRQVQVEGVLFIDHLRRRSLAETGALGDPAASGH